MASHVQSKIGRLLQKMITFDYIENIFCGGVEKPHIPPAFPNFGSDFWVAAGGTMKGAMDNGFFTTKTQRTQRTTTENGIFSF